MNRLRELVKELGVWIMGPSLVALLVAWNYTDSWVGLTVLIGAALLLLIEPALLYDQLSRLPRGHLLSWGLALLTLVLYFVRWLVAPSEESVSGRSFAERLQTILLVLFLLSLLGFWIYRLLIGLAYASVAYKSRSLQSGQEKRMQLAVLSILTAIPVFALAAYATTRWNPTYDFSPAYYSFSEQARTIIRSVDQKVEVTAFLPVLQAVVKKTDNRAMPELWRIAEDVRIMLQQLPVINGKISLQFKNADFGSAEGEDFGSVTNGTIILRVKKTDRIVSSDDKPFVERRVYAYSEQDMKKLEREITRALIQVSTPEKKICFTSSNGERYDWTDQKRRDVSLETFKEELRFYNFRLEKLDHSAGWPGPIKEDCAATVVAGPSREFGKEARAALVEYIKKGGRLFIAIEPNGDEDFSWLLDRRPDKTYVHKKAFLTLVRSFPGSVVTDSLQQHRITENLNIAGRAPVVFPQAGYFEEVPREEKVREEPAILADLEGQVVIGSVYNTFLDKNRNGVKDAGEDTGRFDQVIAFAAPDKDKGKDEEQGKKGTLKDARIVVFSSVDWLSDAGLRFPIDHRNIILAADALFWLTENPLAAALVEKERVSRNIQVTDELKLRNIVLGMIVFPVGLGLAMAAGMWYFRKRRKFVGES